MDRHGLPIGFYTSCAFPHCAFSELGSPRNPRSRWTVEHRHLPWSRGDPSKQWREPGSEAATPNLTGPIGQGGVVLCRINQQDLKMSDLEIALRKLIADVVREELQAAFARSSAQHSADSETRYVSPAQAGVIASVSPATIRAWVREGKLRSFQAGRLLRVSLDDLHAFMKAKPLDSPLTPEEMADKFLERMREQDRTRCPNCRHLPTWRMAGGCRAKKCTCKRRMK